MVELVKPSEEFRGQANVRTEELYDLAREDKEAYWAAWASKLAWSRSWEEVLMWRAPEARWFDGGTLNASVNCLDRQDQGAVALVWEGEPGDQRRYTYGELKAEVERCADGLRRLGVNKGDRVVVYLPLVPELVIACLACARIGAVHSVVFAGLSGVSLRDRIDDLGAKVVVTADFGWRRGKKLPLLEAADRVVPSCASVEQVVVVARQKETSKTLPAKHHWWHEVLAEAGDGGGPVEQAAEDALFVLYTSGTTGRPKGLVHTTGGYLTGVYASTNMVLDVKPGDVYWCTADPGWITGHSYVIYGPLMHGATVVIYEGAPDWPDPGRWWQMIAKYGVNILYTAPTAIRLAMQYGEQYLSGIDMSSLRLLGSVGEPINPRAWWWYYDNVGKRKCPVVDTWWQTETGSIMVATLPGVQGMKPGVAGKPLPGIEAEVREGLMALTAPWPSMARTMYGNKAAFEKTYWSKWPDKAYFAGDAVQCDEDGYYSFIGRADDVLSVSGHRLGTAELENVLVGHELVAEAAVVSIPDEIRGQAIVAFVVLAGDANVLGNVSQLLIKHVEGAIGGFARPRAVLVVEEVPKTRSGKIMRRLLRSLLLGEEGGDVTTLANESAVAAVQKEIVRWR